MDQAALERDVAELRRQVRELTDRNEIVDLISRLGLYLDDKRFDDARSVFTEDAIGPFGDQGVDVLAERSRAANFVRGPCGPVYARPPLDSRGPFDHLE